MTVLEAEMWIRSLAALFLLTALPSAAADRLTWTAAGEGEAGFASLGELRAFLETAAIVDDREIGTGVTRPRKLLLEQNGLRLHAHFQAYDEAGDRIRLASGEVELHFRDSYRFNIAAYELGRLLGMESIPPSFPRTVRGQPGAITLWIEETFTETSRRERGLEPPQPLRWSRQLAAMWVFDELIGNTDRNPGNLLIDRDWKIWLIDHTRAFRQEKRLRYSSHSISSCDRRLWHGLRTVGDDDIRAALEPWLQRGQIQSVLARRRLLVERLGALISERGERVVLFDLDADSQRVAVLDSSSESEVAAPPPLY